MRTFIGRLNNIDWTRVWTGVSSGVMFLGVYTVTGIASITAIAMGAEATYATMTGAFMIGLFAGGLLFYCQVYKPTQRMGDALFKRMLAQMHAMHKALAEYETRKRTVEGDEWKDDN